MGKTSTQVSFWNADMKVNEVISASSTAYFNVKSLKQFSKQTYSLERFDDGTYVARFKNGEFMEFK